jgi:uncharacterized protein with von Willebrand factor type A (vWA) domain
VERENGTEARSQEQLTPSSTVFMVDKSRSMFLNECFSGVREAALALDALIRDRFPRDDLYFVAFSLMATQIQPSDLPLQTPDEYTYGTNFQHGIMLARQLLARSTAQTRQIIIVTDDDPPNAHLEPGEPHPVFSYPSTQRCIAETLREVERATRENIVITTFMLQPSRGPSSFVERMTSINGGRAFYVSPEHLEEDLLAHYVRTKNTTIP